MLYPHAPSKTFTFSASLGWFSSAWGFDAFDPGKNRWGSHESGTMGFNIKLNFIPIFFAINCLFDVWSSNEVLNLLFQFLCLIFFVWFFMEVLHLPKLKTLQWSPWSTPLYIYGDISQAVTFKGFNKGRPHWKLLEVIGAPCIKPPNLEVHSSWLPAHFQVHQNLDEIHPQDSAIHWKSHFKKLVSRLNHLKWIWSPWNGLVNVRMGANYKLLLFWLNEMEAILTSHPLVFCRPPWRCLHRDSNFGLPWRSGPAGPKVHPPKKSNWALHSSAILTWESKTVEIPQHCHPTLWIFYEIDMIWCVIYGYIVRYTILNKYNYNLYTIYWMKFYDYMYIMNLRHICWSLVVLHIIISSQLIIFHWISGSQTTIPSSFKKL